MSATESLSDPHEGHPPHEFTVVSQEKLYEGAILAMRRDNVRMPGGRIAAREKVEHLGAVAIAALDEADRLVMIYQYRPAIGRRIWEMPAGLLDDPSEDPVAAARRELLEEVGVEADEWSTLVDIVGCPGFADESVRVFLARGLRDVGRPESDADDEEVDLVVRRIPLDDLVAGAMSGDLVNGPCVAGVFAAAAVRDGRFAARPADAPWRDRPTEFGTRVATGG